MPRKRETCPGCGKQKAVGSLGCRSCGAKKRRMLRVPPIEERFWSKVDTSGDCRLWTAHLAKGYGHFSLNGRTVKAHRFAYELAYGPVPDGLLICHRCDNPRCVRPDHLWLGTVKSNTRDAVSKGRMFVGSLNISHRRPELRKGERNGAAILTATLAAEIRTRYAVGKVTQQQLATEFGVSQSTISNVIIGKNWKA